MDARSVRLVPGSHRATPARGSYGTPTRGHADGAGLSARAAAGRAGWPRWRARRGCPAPGGPGCGPRARTTRPPDGGQPPTWLPGTLDGDARSVSSRWCRAGRAVACADGWGMRQVLIGPLLGAALL